MGSVRIDFKEMMPVRIEKALFCYNAILIVLPKLLSIV